MIVSTFKQVLTASIEFKRSAGSFLKVLSFFGLPAVFSKIVRPSQMTPIAVCPGVCVVVEYVWRGGTLIRGMILWRGRWVFRVSRNRKRGVGWGQGMKEKRRWIGCGRIKEEGAERGAMNVGNAHQYQSYDAHPNILRKASCANCRKGD